VTIFEDNIETANDLGGIADVPHPYHLFWRAVSGIPDPDEVKVYRWLQDEAHIL
jgi:hypothetical protein